MIFPVTYEDHTLLPDEAERLLHGVLDSEAFRSRMVKIEVIDLEEENAELSSPVCF